MKLEKWSERKALREYYETLIDEQTNIKLEIEMVFNRLRYLDDRDIDIEMQYDPSDEDDLFETETFEDPTQQVIKELDDEIQDSHFPKEHKNALQMLKEKRELDNGENPVDNVEDEKKQKVPTNLVTRLKEYDSKAQFRKSNTKNLNVIDNYTLANIVGTVLQDRGTPTKLNHIMSELSKEGYYANNPSDIMKKVMDANKNIERVVHGVYQYRA